MVKAVQWTKRMFGSPPDASVAGSSLANAPAILATFVDRPTGMSLVEDAQRSYDQELATAALTAVTERPAPDLSFPSDDYQTATHPGPATGPSKPCGAPIPGGTCTHTVQPGARRCRSGHRPR